MELNFIELYEQTGLDLEDFADLLGVSFELVEKWYDGQETPEQYVLQLIESIVDLNEMVKITEERIPMEVKIMELFERTINNCKFYEKENNDLKLLNEIGVLRGIAYVMEEANMSPYTDDFTYFIEKQNELVNNK